MSRQAHETIFLSGVSCITGPDELIELVQYMGQNSLEFETRLYKVSTKEDKMSYRVKESGQGTPENTCL